MFEHCGQRLQQRRTSEHEYTISSPCEPIGSGELKIETTTVMILIFRIVKSGQTVLTQIRLLLEESSEQSDQGLPCLLFHLHWTKYPKIWPLMRVKG